MSVDIAKRDIMIEDIENVSKYIKVLIIINEDMKPKQQYFERMFKNIKYIDENNYAKETSEYEGTCDLVIASQGENSHEIPRIAKLNKKLTHSTIIILLKKDVSRQELARLSSTGIDGFAGITFDEELECLGALKMQVEAVLEDKKRIASLQQENTEAGGGDRKRAPEAPKTKKFMVIEPVIPAQNILKKALSHAGVADNRYKIFDGTEQALASLAQNPYEYQILVLSGTSEDTEIVKTFLDINNELYIQYITSARDTKQLKELVMNGVDDLIFKPFELDVLVEKLKKAENPTQSTIHGINRHVYNLKDLVGIYNDFAEEDNLKSIHKELFKKFFAYIQKRAKTLK